VTGSNNSRDFKFSRAVPINQWTHVAVTYNNGNINFYHNGILTGTTTSPIETLYTGTGSLYIGAYSPSSHTVDGTLDEIRIYNRALSHSEIRELAGLPPCFGESGDLDVDNDGIGDLCDSDTIYGTISGDIQAGVTVKIYTTNCGGDILEATTETDTNGYYSFGGLNSQRYLLVAEETGYSFVPVSDWVDIPQAEIQSYDFTATLIPTCDSVDRFLDNNEGTVTDCRTDLVWLKNASCFSSRNGEDSILAAAGLNNEECGLSDGSVAGDWRLPTIDELEGIGTDPPTSWRTGLPPVTWTMPGEPFVGLHLGYWSSTEDENNSDFVLNLYIVLGYVESFVKYGMGLSGTWPVRGGN
jgi:hypothetical protein